MFNSLFNLLKTSTHTLSQNISNIWFLLHSYTFLFKLRNVITVYIAIYDYLQPKYYNILSKKKNFINMFFLLFKILLITLLLV
jgi:hypothetical protein